MSIDKDDILRLTEAALNVRKNSYAPYSGFYVGAALLAKSGMIYTGVNCENSSYPVGICAERTAFSSALTAGEREFAAIAVAGGKDMKGPEDFCYPCGMCRQFMAEYCKGEFEIIIAKSRDEYRIYRLDNLLPYIFELDTTI